MERARKRSETSRRHLLKTRHSMTTEEYDELLEFQGGVCYICRRAKGVSRKLSVDHDHLIARDACAHDPAQSCNNCWRGLLCAKDNAMLGHLRDDPMAFWRALDYLKHPPARLLRNRPLGMEGHAD